MCKTNRQKLEIIAIMILLLITLLSCGSPSNGIIASSETQPTQANGDVDNPVKTAGAIETFEGIVVYNAVGIKGLAGDVATLLAKKGIPEVKGENWNAARPVKTYIFYQPGSEKKAREVADWLSVEELRSRNSGDPEVAVGIVLGDDFDDWNLFANPALPSGDMSVMSQKSAPTKETAAPKSVTSPEGIYISLSKRVISLYRKGEIAGSWKCAVGAPDSPTPTGEYKITSKTVKPDWSWKGKIVPPGPKNGLGLRFLGISKPSYGIHGTNDPDSIGKAISHGCIRLHNLDVIALFDLVKAGDKVTIVP